MVIRIWYNNSYFLINRNSKKSRSWWLFTLNWGTIMWQSIKLIECIANFTMEAKYAATCEVTKKVIWFKKFLTDLKIVQNTSVSITLYCDNSVVVANSKNPSYKIEKDILIGNIIWTRNISKRRCDYHKDSIQIKHCWFIFKNYHS